MPNAFVLAALLATPASLGIHPGASATVRIDGAAPPITVTATGTVATTSVDQQTGTIVVTAGTAPGAETLHVTDAAGDTLDVPLLVAPDAAAVPPAIELNVTGNPLDPAWLSRAIAGAVTRAVAVQPGATLQPGSFASPPPPAPGSTIAVTVPVVVAGNGRYLDVNAQTNVTVNNLPLEPLAPPYLYYDDDPEHVSADGVSYRGVVQPGTPARLYFYHDVQGDAHRIVLVLTAASPSRVAVIDSVAGPNIDVLSVGHAVTRDFLAQKGRNQATVYDLQPGVPLVLHDVNATNKQLVAGSVEFNVVQGGAVTASVLSVSPGTDPLALLNGPLLPHDGHHRTGIFDITNFGTDSLAFAAGGPDASSTFGNKSETPPNADPQSDGTDYGDYGVVHTFLFSVSNPAATTSRVYLYERPAGGYVRASYLVNGSLVDVGCVRDNTKRYQIGAYDLAPSQHYLFTVQTMTEGGSNYPVEVGMTSTPPVPFAPPMSAPDGCFPKG